MSSKRFSKRTVKHLCIQSYVMGKTRSTMEFDEWIEKELEGEKTNE